MLHAITYDMNPVSYYRRFRASFSSRLFLIFTLFTGLIAALFVVVLISAELRNYRERSSEKAHLLASLLAGSIRVPSLVGSAHMFSCGTIASEKRIGLQSLRLLT